MRALISTTPGGPHTLAMGDLPDPEPREGELLISVKACGINFPDVLVIQDQYQFKPARPFAPGSEVAGEVIGVGAGVTGWSVGDRMVGTMLGSGGLAERAVVKAAMAFHLPEDFPFVEAGGLLLTYATALHALKDRGRLLAGQTLLVLGAGGGVGLAAVEVGRAICARVIAAVSSADKAAAARAAGATDVVPYPQDLSAPDGPRDLAAAFKHHIGPAGADVILDPVGGDYTVPALRSIAWDGRLLVVGFPAGIPRIPANLMLMKGCAVVGVFQGAFAERFPQENARNVAMLFEWWRAGAIKPRVSEVYPLEQGADAIARLASRQAIGKLVVSVG